MDFDVSRIEWFQNSVEKTMNHPLEDFDRLWQKYPGERYQALLLNKRKRKCGDDPKYWAEVFEHTLCIKIILLHLIRVYAIFFSAISNN